MKFYTKALKQLLLIIALSTVTIACTDSSGDRQVVEPTNEQSGVEGESDMTTQPVAVEGTVWNLLSLNGQPLLSESEITAEFADGRVNGSAGCNLYFADYQLDDTQLKIERIGSTKKACPDVDGLMEQESTYLNLLSQAESTAMVNNLLTIKTSDSDGELVFEAGGNPVEQ